MHGGVGPEATRQAVPLHPRAHPVDDAVEDEAQIGAGSACGRGGVVALEDRLDALPELVGELPDRRQGVFRGSVGHRQGTLLSRGMCLAVSVQGDITPASPFDQMETQEKAAAAMSRIEDELDGIASAHSARLERAVMDGLIVRSMESTNCWPSWARGQSATGNRLVR